MATASRQARPIRQKLSDVMCKITLPRNPRIPKSLNDRQSEAWEPLLAIGEAAGAQWTRRLQKAAEVLSVSDMDDDSMTTLLLQDLKTVFIDGKIAHLSSKALVMALINLDDSPWAEVKLKPHRLSQLLRPHGVKPKAIRNGKDVFKGYQAKDFEQVWARWL
jgi:hypothetical protein